MEILRLLNCYSFSLPPLLTFSYALKQLSTVRTGVEFYSYSNWFYKFCCVILGSILGYRFQLFQLATLNDCCSFPTLILLEYSRAEGLYYILFILLFYFLFLFCKAINKNGFSALITKTFSCTHRTKSYVMSQTIGGMFLRILMYPK